jgi:hypothetical protein
LIAAARVLHSPPRAPWVIMETARAHPLDFPPSSSLNIAY